MTPCRWLVLLALIAALPARAQVVLTRSEQVLVNFGFATQLGSGVYTVSGRTLQIYRLPFAYALEAAQESGIGVKLTLPVTLGFYDFKLRDVADTGLPRHVDALSFVPGVTFSIPVRPGWRLEPFVEAGISKAGDAQADAYGRAAQSLQLRRAWLCLAFL